MKSAGELFENAMLHWRDKVGVGTALIPAPLNDKVMVLGILQRMYARSPTCKVIVLTSNFNDRVDLIEFITTQKEEENNTEFKNLMSTKTLKVLTFDFALKHRDSLDSFLCIAYRPTEVDDSVAEFISRSKYKLIVLNKLLDTVSMTRIYKICPLLDDFKQNEVEAVRTSTPVEETCINVPIPENSEAYRLLDYCNQYISTSIAIFGSFDIMQQARLGNNQLNISAAQICAQIANENGWNEHLDMSIEFNVQLDNLYNPANLRERATQTYEEIRKRSQLLSDYDDKLEYIFNIVQQNPDKKILVINKRGEFASKVTDYINNLSDTIICGNYHDKVESIPAVDITGKPLYYKSGAHKGERRMMAAQAQKSFNESAFNRGALQVLSTNNAPDKSLCIDVDIVIITSPQCESIKTYLYRLTEVGFNQDHIELYTIYCSDSMEEKLMDSRVLPHNYKIINNCEKTVSIENNSDFIVVD